MVAIPAVLGLALGCGGGGSGSTAPQAAAANNEIAATTTITGTTPVGTVTPASATLAPGATQTFTTNVNGTANAPVTWSVDGIQGGNAAVGTISAQVQAQAASAGFLRKAYYTAGSSTQTVSVVAGDLVIVGWTVGNSPGTTTCSDSSGNTYQAIGSPAYSSGVDGSAYAFYGIAKTTNTSLKISVTSVDTSGPDIFVHVVGGMSSTLSSVLDTAATHVDSANATTHSTGTLATTSADDYLFTVWAQDSNSTAINENGTGFTIENYDFVGNASSYNLATAAGSYKETVSTSKPVMMGSIIAAFRPAFSTVSASYTAPASGGTHSITAVNGANSASSAITVTAPAAPAAPAVTVTDSPATASTNPGGAITIVAAVSGSTNTAVTWAVDGIANGNATVGTITGSGNSVSYNAPASGGTHKVTATSVANPADSATTTVSVMAAAQVITVAVNPTSASIATGGTTAVTATVSGTTNSAVTWTVDGVSNGNASVGTLAGTGNTKTYTAPATGGTHSVVATSAASITAGASMAVTVKAPVVTVALNPSSSSTVVASKTLPVTASVTGSSNTAVTWTVDGVSGGNATVGVLAGTGNAMTYTAPSAAGIHTVCATSVANPADSASTVLSVTAASSGATTAVALTPSAPTAVGSGGQLTFSASMTGSTGDTAAWSVDGIAGGNATVGTISAAGVYTCPAVKVQTIHTIKATSVDSPGVSASVPILATVSNTTINAKTQYGATGNGSTDDTAAINNALSASGNGICYLPAGTYMINATASGSYGLNIPAGATLLMAPGATLKCITQSTSGDYKIVRMAASNSAVVGGAIVGDRVARNLPTYNNGVGPDFENGQGIAINGSGGATGMIVLGVTINDNCCDGIYMYNGANGVTIDAVTCNNNRRQGISIVYGTKVLIENSTFSNTNGQDPAFGIDLEPSGSGQVVTYVQILNCTFTANKGGGIGGGSSNASVNNITVSGNTLTGNGGSNYGVGGIYFNDGASSCTFSNNTITGNLAGGDDGGILLSGVSNMTVTGNTVKNNAGYGIAFSSASGSTCSGNTVSGNSKGAIYADGSATIGTNTTN